MASLTKPQTKPEEVTPQDVIFSCSLCNATFSEVYSGHAETVQGLSDGINPKNRLATKLFLAGCSHVICSKHFEGGGPPFHKANERPHAPCPVCVKEKSDTQPRQLFSVRGFKKGEYDPGIPKCFFLAPPMKLDSSGAEMEALRFQYKSLLRFGREITCQSKEARDRASEMQSDLMRLRQQCTEQQTKLQALEKENERLRPMERDLLGYRERMPAIKHFLGLIPTLTEQNGQMRQQLASLGYEIPHEPMAYDGDLFPLAGNDSIIPDSVGEPMTSTKRAISSHTVGRSAHATANLGEGTSSSPQARPYKRLKQLSSQTEPNIHALPTSKPRVGSRDLMPPPSKPLSRIKSIKQFIPNFRRKVSRGRNSPHPTSSAPVEPDIQMCERGHWEGVDQPAPFTSATERPHTQHGFQQESVYMTGALPRGHPPRLADSPDPEVLPSAIVEEDAPQSSYLPAMPQAGQPVRLPSAPSYIQLIDLGQDNDVNLEIRDPRRSSDAEYRPNPRFEESIEIPRRRVRSNNPSRWSLGHAHLRQSPKTTTEVIRHPDPLRSNPPRDSGHGPSGRPSFDPVTPAPQRFQQPAQAESVVSPFFESSHHNSQVYSRTGVTERNSLNRSVASQYQRPRMMHVQSDWHEPRSLNGLSFFNSPRNTQNEPIRFDNGHARSNQMDQSQQYWSRNLDSRGFMKRPDTERSSWLDDSAYSSSFGHGQSITSFPLNHPSHLRAAPLPAPVPSIISSNRSPARSSGPQLDSLAHVGVRSGQPIRSHFPGSTFTPPTRNLFSSAGRRSVRR
ncbi:hypothetical protein CC78DRAFT_355927 [Lojkania enalia]|uniref:Uncharacterized protein n=1 Tax=Lojkania enalia TaxID=147567 RepID=A0A9P4K8J8_9PLEO|nr:hypothetical protein CC78DRAFT_355927 [Didymosphaeria enalia]